MDQLVALAIKVEDIPNLKEIDEMLAVLVKKPKCRANDFLLDSLLELRSRVS